MKRYEVTCKKCKGSDILGIDETYGSPKVFFTKHLPIIAARWRPDLNWGFECTCGNDSRLAPEEAKIAEVVVAGVGKPTVANMVKTLERKPNTRFNMVAV